MAFDDTFKISVHGVFTDSKSHVLQLRQTYGDLSWGLPGGAVDPGETVLQTLRRECREEIGCEIIVGPLTGIYLHTRFNSHAMLFRCYLKEDSKIKLSSEHLDWKYFPLEELSKVQRQRITDCLNYDGNLNSAIF